MKTPRTEKLAIVVGRNRRVYGRTYKMDKSIPEFAARYFTREAKKGLEEGFTATYMTLYQPNENTFIYTVVYKEDI